MAPGRALQIQGRCLLLPLFLQVMKSTGDVAGGRALYEGYAAVTDAPPECFLTLRDTVLLRKESRKLIVQPNTRLEGNGVRGLMGTMQGLWSTKDALGQKNLSIYHHHHRAVPVVGSRLEGGQQSRGP